MSDIILVTVGVAVYSTGNLGRYCLKLHPNKEKYILQRESPYTYRIYETLILHHLFVVG